MDPPPRSGPAAARAEAGVRTRLKALVIGASGLVGGHLVRILSASWRMPVLGTCFSAPGGGLARLDYCNAAAVNRLIDGARPEVIFCPAAQPNVEWCESHPAESYQVNVLGTQNVAAACKRKDTVLVYFSSDYVFDGESGPYDEQARPNPINVYGRHKLAAEEAVRSLLPQHHIIVRTTVVYGWEPSGKNYVARLVRNLREGKPWRAPRDQIGSPTPVVCLAEAAGELAERRLFGTWHIAGPERMSRYEFACLAARTFKFDSGLIEPVNTDALQQKAPRPLRAGMTIAKAAGALRTRLLAPAEGLRMMRDDPVSSI